MNNTLIGKDGYLFLISEINKHSNNLCSINQDLSRYNKYLNNFLIIVIPDKSYIYSEYLPDNYNTNNRPNFLIYKDFFKNKLYDSYEDLKNIKNIYYKTDTHMNLNGMYNIYINFIKKVNDLYNLNIPTKNLDIKCQTNIILNNLGLGTGDLTWPNNKGDLILPLILDDYYYSDDLILIYLKKNIYNILYYDYNFNIINIDLQQIIDWKIISTSILYKKNITSIKKKVLIFYDSFILPTVWLYLTMFEEVYMSKHIFTESIIDKINPDYVFEFRIERFLI